MILFIDISGQGVSFMTRKQFLMEKRRKRMKRRRFTIAFIIIFSLFSIGMSHKYGFGNISGVVEAGDLSESILLISEKSAVNMALTHERELLETKKAEEIQAQMQKELEEKRNANRKIAYLTFDDGPSAKVTPQILDVLDKYNVKATFFVIGNQAEQYPDLIKRIDASGHAIGNHSYTHSYKNIYQNTTNFLNELKTTEKVLKNILGEDYKTNIIRFPGGSFGQKKAAFRKVVVDNGYTYYDWNALNGDAEGKSFPKDRLVQRLINTANGQKKLIILMHDMGGKQTTADALPEIIEYLQKNGYEFEVLK